MNQATVVLSESKPEGEFAGCATLITIVCKNLHCIVQIRVHSAMRWLRHQYKKARQGKASQDVEYVDPLGEDGKNGRACCKYIQKFLHCHANRIHLYNKQAFERV